MWTTTTSGFCMLSLLLFLGKPALALDVCRPQGCKCTHNEIVCRNLRLTKVPDDLPTSGKVTKIDLSQNYLTSLPVGYFQMLPNLREILLDSNGLTFINETAFQNLQLEKLSLKNNRFSTVPFKALDKVKKTLVTLNMDRNMVESVGESNFVGFTKLKDLNLANNLISKVSASAFKGLSNLETITLSNNQIASVSEIALDSVPNLRELDISDNSLKSFPQGINRLNRLRKLSLYGNRIESIGAKSVQGCQMLEELEIRGNPLKFIHVDAFKALPSLSQLIISEAAGMSDFPNLNGTSQLTRLRLDRASIHMVPRATCKFLPNLRSLELKSNKIEQMPDLRECKELRLIDFGHNRIRSLLLHNGTIQPLDGLSHLHDLHVSHNLIEKVEEDALEGLDALEVLDLSNNRIRHIHENAFVGLDSLVDINVGVNEFDKFPSKGLKNVRHVKTHNNPRLQDFPGVQAFPEVQTLTLSYAYHCCQFLPSTYQNLLPDYNDYGSLKESVFFPGEGNFDLSLWQGNGSFGSIWSDSNSNTENNSTTHDLWSTFGANFGEAFTEVISTKTPTEVHCTPTPGPFLPCNDLFDWWTLRCSVWIVFLLALLGNGCVVIVLIASRGKMDVPRFLVCNLAMADFFMGLYLGFLAIVDASTLGQFRKFALPWQFSAGCQAAGFFAVLSSELSVFTLAVITLERNYAITHAMHLNKRLSLRHAAYILAGGWVFALFMATLPLVGVSDYRKFAVCLPFETGDALSLSYVIFLMFINGVAFSILMGCYLKMYCAIRGSQAWNSNDSRIAKRMALLVFTDFICWAPIAFLAFCSCLGWHLISLEQAKVFTIFVLPLNSCCNPFLYAILTKQFKKDCVMICKAIEESRVTRGIGRCRHSSNFSNRQTPANTNSLNSGSGTHGSHSRGTVCSCNAKKGKGSASLLTARWPFNKIKHMFHHGYKDTSTGEHFTAAAQQYHRGGGGTGQTVRGVGVGPQRGALVNGTDYTQQIAQIQQKQNRTERHASVSSDNFSSSRSDSWRHHGNCLPGFRLGQSGGPRYQRHRRRNSWTVTRKPSQDSQLSSSRNDSASSNSTNTWRMSRSSVSSEMSNSIGRTNSNPKNPTHPAMQNLNATAGAGAAAAAAIAAADPFAAMLTGAIGGAGGGTAGKFSALAQRTQARAAAAAAAAAASSSTPTPASIMKNSTNAPVEHHNPDLVPSSSQGSVGGSKPKLIRQSAILADGDSSGSYKSVTFQDPPSTGSIGRNSGSQPCPVHSAEYAALLANRYRQLYKQLIESNQADEESDMEASDAEEDPQNEESDGMPLGTTYRTIAAAQAAALTAAVAAAQQQPTQQQLLLQKRAPSSGRLGAGFMPRKLSTIASKDSVAKDDEEEQEFEPLNSDCGETVVERPSVNTTAAVIETQPELEMEQSTSFNPEPEPEKDESEAEREALLPDAATSTTKVVVEGNRRYLNTDV